MPTASKSAPVKEISDCASACARWLIDKGLLELPKDGKGGLGDAGFYLDRTKIRGAPPDRRASAVVEILCWLSGSVLPVIDERRPRSHNESAKGSPRNERDQVHDGNMDPSKSTALSRGMAEYKLAGATLRISDRIFALEGRIEAAAKRQANEATGTAIRAAYKKLTDDIVTLLRMVGPKPGTYGVEAWPAPHRMKDWSNIRTQLELHLHGAGCTDSEITELLPGCGSAKAVEQRRYRARHDKPERQTLG